MSDQQLQFRKYNGTRIDDIGQYVSAYLQERPDTEIFVGTDSQTKGYYTNFVTAVCLYTPSKGAHVVYARSRQPKITNVADKMWRETMLTIQVMDEVRTALPEWVPIDRFFVDFDINPDPKHASNVMHTASVGYALGYGIPARNIRTKPYAHAASRAADALCR